MSDLNEIMIYDHVCSIHEDREQSLSLAAAFLKSGLDNWEKCLYIGSEKEISERLERTGVEEKYFRTGQLKIARGETEPEERLSLIRENLELAMKEGYRCLRVAQEMRPHERLLEYEAELNDLFMKNPALGLCLYEKKLFDVQILLRAVKAHPGVYAANMLCENPHYLNPLEDGAERELQAYLGTLIDKTTLKKQHAECETRSREILKEKTKKLQDSRDAIFNMLKDMDESYKKLQKAYEDLQTLDKMKDEFISNVSHELKTPLISIKGYGELLYDEKQGSISDEQKKSLEAIIRNADRLTRLINSILFISRLQAGKIEFRFEPVDMDEIINICTGDLKGMMDGKQIIFEKAVQKISRVMGEKDRYIEVLNNLLDNAIKFTPMGGKISIKAWDEAENVHLIVSDNGIGIPKEIIPKLFMRFYQVDASASRKYGGAGLGLYITKNIIDAFHGRVWVESEVGKGTRVHMLLPVYKETG